MENFKLSNLRELSTEEQLRLNGGIGANASCSCSGCSCSCDKPDDNATVDNVRDNVKDSLKSK